MASLEEALAQIIAQGEEYRKAASVLTQQIIAVERALQKLPGRAFARVPLIKQGTDGVRTDLCFGPVNGSDFALALYDYNDQAKGANETLRLLRDAPLPFKIEAVDCLEELIKEIARAQRSQSTWALEAARKAALILGAIENLKNPSNDVQPSVRTARKPTMGVIPMTGLNNKEGK